MEKVAMVSPWIDYVKKLEALFGPDPTIKVQYIDEEKKVKLLVKGTDKSNALTKVMPEEVSFGNVSLKVEVVPSNEPVTNKELMDIIFKGNRLYGESIEIDPRMVGNPFTYVMFRPEAVQYWGDNMGDPHGMITVLPQDIAKEVFRDTNGVFFSTRFLEATPF